MSYSASKDGYGSSRSSTPLVSEASEPSFIWIDDSQTSSASGGRRGVRRLGRDHDLVRRHAARVSAAARLATIRRKLLEDDVGSVRPDYSGVQLQASTPSRESSPADHNGSADMPSWYILRLLGGKSFHHDAIRFNTVNQKS